MDDDEEMMSIFDEKYGEESCTFDECRRLNQIAENQAYGPFIIQSLNSSVLSVANCENAEELCYEVSTNVSILHYPVTYSIERTELIVLSTVLNFLEDRSVIPISVQPETVTTSISMIFSGVQPEVMDVEEQTDFIGVVFDYLEDILGRFDPPILVEVVTFDSQSLVVDVVGVQSEDVRFLEEATLNETEISELTVNVVVVGQYLPPPEIDFDNVVVEVFDSEGEQGDFLELIDESNNTYFEPVIKDVSLVSVEVTNDIPSTSRSDSFFGDLGEEGGIVVMSASSIVLVVAVALIWREHHRKVERKRREEELRSADPMKHFDEKDRHRESREEHDLGPILYDTVGTRMIRTESISFETGEGYVCMG